MPTFSYTIRPATLADTKALAGISESTFRTAFQSDNDPDDFEAYVKEAFSLETIKSEIEDTANRHFLVEIEGEVKGYLKIRKGKIPKCLGSDNAIELERIYITSELQGKGIGEKLFLLAKDIAIEEGFDMLWLGVWGLNTGAIRFYQRMGMKKYGSHVFQLGEDKQEDWVMGMELER